MCTNCFSRAHTGSNCTSSKKCKVCSKNHHSLLHLTESTKWSAILSANTNAENQPSCSVSEKKFSSAGSSASQKKFVILPSAIVRFVCGNVASTARILIDNCSQPTLISDCFVRRRRLPTFKVQNSVPIRGAGSKIISVARFCSLKIFSRINSFEMEI